MSPERQKGRPEDKGRAGDKKRRVGDGRPPGREGRPEPGSGREGRPAHEGRPSREGRPGDKGVAGEQAPKRTRRPSRPPVPALGPRDTETDRRAAGRDGGRRPSGSHPVRRAAADAVEAQPALTARDLLTLYRPELALALAALDAPAYRYGQVCEHLFRRPTLPFAQSTTLPPDIRAALDSLGASTLAVTGSRTSRDRSTKLLLSAEDGAAIEMVVMRYRQRVTACISSQVGCPVGCSFCATGAGGLERNLTVAEIVDQLRAAVNLVLEEGTRLSNVVYMGMGEPLLNLQAVLGSIRVITHPQGLGIGHRSLSISTVGIPAGIRRLARTEPQVNLALSLHAPDDRTRALLIPDTFRHPMSKVLNAAWDHFEVTRRKLLVEYVLLAGVNDSPTDARRLAALLKGHVVTVNLLAWNPVAAFATPPGPSARKKTGRTGSAATCSDFQPSSPAAIAAFRDALVGAGIEAVIRQSKGAAIDAACGQLAGRTRRPAGGR